MTNAQIHRRLWMAAVWTFIDRDLYPRSYRRMVESESAEVDPDWRTDLGSGDEIIVRELLGTVVIPHRLTVLAVDHHGHYLDLECEDANGHRRTARIQTDGFSDESRIIAVRVCRKVAHQRKRHQDPIEFRRLKSHRRAQNI